jgi:hypothetical protein
VMAHPLDLTFKNSLRAWPYRTLGIPRDEVAALDYLHTRRISAPDLPEAERQLSLDYLKAKGFYEWVLPFVKGKVQPKKEKANVVTRGNRSVSKRRR